MDNLKIGTSGWHYDHWTGPFYPEKIKKEEQLAFYSQHFDTVEINNSFYNVPSKDTLRKWMQTTPDNFTFTFKANRYTTHMKKLKEPQQSLPKLKNAVEALKGKLGPVLFQLPPNFHYNGKRLKTFVSALPDKYRYAFEFRDPDWLRDEAYRTLSDANAALVIHDMPGIDIPKKITADFTYIRFHGAEQPYQGKYNKQQLAGWAGAISTWMQKGVDVYCYFNNDQNSHAVENALELKDMLTANIS